MGLAVSGACHKTVRRCLGELGITTNRVHGEWSGVSFARYQRLVELVHGCLCIDERHAPRGGAALLMRFVWEKARSKQDMLRFLQAVHSHVPVLEPSFAADPSQQQEFLSQSFTADEIENDDALLAAATHLLDHKSTDMQFAQAYELLAAATSAVHAFRAPICLERHSYKDGKEVPDCVEVRGRAKISMAKRENCYQSSLNYSAGVS